MKQDQQILLEQPAYDIRELYNKYAGMLLGYFFEITKNRTLAEEYLVKTFKVIPQHLQQINKTGTNSWLYLQQLAKSQAAGFLEDIKKDKSNLSNYSPDNKYLALMNDNQRVIFYNVYYLGKTVATLSEELNLTADTIRKLLKEAFTIMRSAV